MMTMFGSWLDSRLDSLGWTNAYLAEKVGVTTGAVWGWREDRYPPSIKHIPLIADAFGVSEFEVYCAVRGLDFDQVSDGRLMRLLNLHPGDSERVIELAVMLIPVVQRYAEKQQHALDVRAGIEKGYPTPVAVDEAALRQEEQTHGQRGRSREVLEEAVNEERQHHRGGRGKRTVQMGKAS